MFAAFLRIGGEEELILALFNPNTAIDKHGNVMVLKDEDFSGLVTLAQRAAMVPRPPNGEWQMIKTSSNEWTEGLWVKNDSGASIINVCGFSPWIVLVD